MADSRQGTLRIDYSGTGGGRGPATWGQRHIWASFLDNRGNPARFTLRRAWPVPVGRTVADVAAALRALVEQHEALRTRFEVDSGALLQVVGQGGLLPCPVTDAATEWSQEAALRAASEPLVAGFGLDEEPPVRFRVLTFRGTPQWIVAAISHLIVDAEACGRLQSDLHGLLTAAGTPTSATCQPLQRARFEQSSEGRSQNARALRHWRTVLERHPEWLFPIRTDSTHAWHGERFAVVQAHAPGLGRHVERIAGRLRVSAPALCVAAFCKAFATCSDATAYPLGVTLSNRVLSWSRGYIGTLAQHGVIGVRDVQAPLDQLARQTWHSLLLSHRFSLYDQDDVFALISQMCGGECDWFGPVANFVNFQYLSSLSGVASPAEDPAGRALVFADLDPQKDSAVRFGLHIGSDTTDLVIRMSVDQACLRMESVREAIAGAASELWSAKG